MSEYIDADAAKLAGLQINYLQKLRKGQLTLPQLEWWIDLSLDDRRQIMAADLDQLGLRSNVPTPPFYNVRIGEMSNAHGARRRLERAHIEYRAIDRSLDTYSYETTVRELRWTVRTGIQLGLEHNTSFGLVQKRAEAAGLSIGTEEMILELCLQYPKKLQLHRRHLAIMRSKRFSLKTAPGLEVVRADCYSIGSVHFRQSEHYPPNTRWIFFEEA